MKYVFFAALCVACGSGGASMVVEVPPAETQAPPPPTVQVVVAPAYMHAGEEWVGRYTCAQGETDLDLHINRVEGDQLEATFEFSHGPSGADGAYQMRGSISPNGQVTLVPGPWIRRPSGYVGVGLHGDVRGATLSGAIDNPSCSGFTVRRR